MSNERAWSEQDIGKLDGRVAVVTGGNSGIGFETARGLAAHGARVVLACRDRDRGDAAAERIAAAVPGSAVRAETLDLADLGSVRCFADAMASDHDGIDIVVNNAGVAGGPHRRTADGFEMHFGTNHLGHFALTGLLLPGLLARPGARVVTLSSSVAAQGRIDFADLQCERGYRFVSAYAASKLANLMFATELDRRAKQAGVNLMSLAANPGIVRTDLLRSKTGAWGRGARPAEFAVRSAQRLLGRSPGDGALPSLYAATAPDLHGGEYLGGRMNGGPARAGIPRRALDVGTVRRLWERSIELSGVGFGELARHAQPNPA